MDSKAERAKSRKERFLERKKLLEPFQSSDLRALKGGYRAVFASKRIPAGTTVCREAATANICLDEFSKDFCATCLREFPSGGPTVCQKCKARHCSSDCAKRDRYHPFECELVADRVFADAAVDSQASVDLLRLVGRLMIARYLDGQTSNPETISTVPVPTPYRLVEDIVAHEQMGSSAWHTSVATGSRILLERMPKELTSGLQIEDLVGLGCRINANSYAIGDPEGALNALAVCLFPIGCMFNHSCDPNVAFVCGSQLETQGEVLFRAVRDVEEGEELTVSYINLYQPRPARRLELLMTKDFLCRCTRCSSPRGSEQWLADLAIEGMKCGCGGLFAPPLGLGDDLDFDALPDDTTLECHLCSNPLPISNYHTATSALHKSHASALELHSSGRHLFSSTLFTTLLSKHSLTFSDVHYLLHSADTKLAESLSHSDSSFERAIEHLRSSIARLDGSKAFPRNWPDCATVRISLAQLCEMQAELLGAKDGNAEEARGLVDEAKRMWEEAIGICKVLYGDEHPRTGYVERIAGCPVPI